MKSKKTLLFASRFVIIFIAIMMQVAIVWALFAVLGEKFGWVGWFFNFVGVLAFFLITAVLTVASVLFFVYLDDFKTMGIINIAFCSLTLIGYLTFAYNVIKGEFLKKFHL